MSIESIVAQGRRLAATSFLDSGLIYDRSFTDDELGGRTETWTPRGSAVPCRVVQPRDPVLEGRDGLLQQAGVRVLLLTVGTDIDENDHIQVNGTKMYTVVSDMAPYSETAVVDRYLIREL
jgi:hypothetical protein